MDLHRMRLEQAPARSPTSFSNRGGVLALLSGLRPRLRFRSDEGVVDRRQRVEIRGLAAEVPGLIDVPAGLVGLTEPIEVLGVLLVRLLELGRGLVVVLFSALLKDIAGTSLVFSPRAYCLSTSSSARASLPLSACTTVSAKSAIRRSPSVLAFCVMFCSSAAAWSAFPEYSRSMAIP